MDTLVYDRCARKLLGGEEGEEGFRFHDVAIQCDADGLLIRRPFFSNTNFFYAYQDPVFFAAPTFRSLCQLLKTHDVTLECDMDYVLSYLQFQCPFTCRTIVRSVSCLRAGETVRLNFYAETVERHMALPAQTEKTRIDVREKLFEILRDIEIGEYAFHISSGLDSTALALLASRLSSAPLTLLTCQTLGRGASDELPLIEKFATDLGAELQIVDCRTIDVFFQAQEMMDSLLYPLAHPSHLLEFLLDTEAKRAGCVGVVNGAGPDECVAGYPWHLPEYSDSALHYARVTVTAPETVTTWFKPSAIAGTRAAPYADYPVWRQNPKMTLSQRLAYDMRTISHAWNIIHAAFAEGLSLAVCSPFMDEAIRRSFFFLPDELKIRADEQKWYQRHIFRNDYPDYIAQNPKKGFRIDLRPYMLQHSPQALTKLIVEASEFGEGYLHKNQIQALAEELHAGQKNWGWQIWSLYLVALSYARLFE